MYYDERAGLCFTEKPSEHITVQGPVSAGIMAIGGETTGIIIEVADNQSYELIVKKVEEKKLTKLSGIWFEVSGNLISLPAVERKKRPAIIVENLHVLE